MVDLNNFDANKVEPSTGGFSVVPAGDYLAVMVKSEKKKSAAGDDGLALTWQILEGDHKGSEINDWLNCWHKKDQVARIAWSEVSAICHATGVMTPKETEELHNKPVMLAIAVRKYTKDGDEKMANDVKKYLSPGAAKTGATTKAAAATTEEDGEKKAPWAR